MIQSISPLLLYVFLPFIIGMTYYVTGKTFLKQLSLMSSAGLIAYTFYLKSVHGLPVYGALISVPLPYGMSLKMDELSSILILLNNFLFFITTMYGFDKTYFKKRFAFVFLSLQGIINAIFLSTDLFNLYILLEIATVLVAILIMTKKENRSVYDGLIYLMSNLVAMAFFLMGIGYCYKLFGALNLDHLKMAINAVENPKVLLLPFAFLMTGVSLKAAIMPLFSWLPRAHATPSAPSIVSVILSGIFIKTGIYLLLKIHWLFGDQLALMPLFLGLGYLTAVLGFVFAIAQTDIKLILAYSTISQMGLILIGIGYNTDSALMGVQYHILSHGLFKSLLFLCAGVLIEHYHTRNITEMHHLWKSSKPLSITLIIGILSITGAPFFSGSISKALLSSTAPSFLMTFISVGTLLYYAKFFNVIFSFDTKPVVSFNRLSLKRHQWASLFMLSALCFILGSFYQPAITILLNQPLPNITYYSFLKLISYIFTYLFCIIFYYKIVKRIKLLDKLKTFDLSFNAISIALVLFFTGILSYLLIQ